jgi:hypothetical protein
MMSQLRTYLPYCGRFLIRMPRITFSLAHRQRHRPAPRSLATMSSVGYSRQGLQTRIALVLDVDPQPWVLHACVRHHSICFYRKYQMRLCRPPACHANERDTYDRLSLWNSLHNKHQTPRRGLRLASKRTERTHSTVAWPWMPLGSGCFNSSSLAAKVACIKGAYAI